VKKAGLAPAFFVALLGWENHGFLFEPPVSAALSTTNCCSQKIAKPVAGAGC
jgi:hypothetical protein